MCSPTVLPSSSTIGPGVLRQVAVEELAERPLADEADAGRVLLRVVRQAGLERRCARTSVFFSSPTGNEHARELRLVQAVQEVALVLRARPCPSAAEAAVASRTCA